MMKRLFCLFLAVFLLLPAFGCHVQQEDPSFTFYYPRSDYGYNAQEGKFYNSIIGTELRNDIIYQDVAKILEVYLKGPLDQTLANPFPKRMSLVAVNVEGQTLQITVSDHLSELTGINLTIVCACLGRTGMELTNTSSVQISCEKALLDGKKNFVIEKEFIIFDDTVTTVTDEQE